MKNGKKIIIVGIILLVVFFQSQFLGINIPDKGMNGKKATSKYFEIDSNENTLLKVSKHKIYSIASLAEEKITSAYELINFMEKVGELSDILAEEMAWRYINMTRFADDEKYSKKFNEFYAGVIAKTKPFDFKFNRKFYDSPYRQDLDKEQYAHLNMIIANDIELYREENIPLQVKEQELANKYGSIFSKLTVMYKGEEKTLSQLAPFLKDQDRDVRKEIWNLRMEKMMEKREEFNKLFDEMKEIRIQIAKNAGFDNYRDFMHQAKGRFSYSPEDNMKFHDAGEK